MANRLHKPKELRLLKLKQTDYKIIGEIAVLSGIVEQQLKRLIILMARAPYPDGYALVAHLNVTSLLDIVETLIPSTTKSPKLQKRLETVTKLAREAFSDRNDLVHGPFQAIFAVKFGESTILKVTVRRKLGYKIIRVPPSLIRETFTKMANVNELLWADSLDIETEYEKRDRENLLSQNQSLARKATPRKLSRQPKSSQGK